LHNQITKGEPKEVLDVICPRDGIIDFVAVGEAKKFWKGDLANDADAGSEIIEFSVGTSRLSTSRRLGRRFPNMSSKSSANQAIPRSDDSPSV
jgi:hypothetical protein